MPFRDVALPEIPLQCWGAAVAVEPVEATVLADLLGPLPAVWRDGVQDEAHWQHYTTMGACPPAAGSPRPGCHDAAAREGPGVLSSPWIPSPRTGTRDIIWRGCSSAG